MLLMGWDSGPEKLCFFSLRPVGSGCNISGRSRRPDSGESLGRIDETLTWGPALSCQEPRRKLRATRVKRPVAHRELTT
jgi:hypothetical protein